MFIPAEGTPTFIGVRPFLARSGRSGSYAAQSALTSVLCASLDLSVALSRRPADCIRPGCCPTALVRNLRSAAAYHPRGHVFRQLGKPRSLGARTPWYVRAKSSPTFGEPTAPPPSIALACGPPLWAAAVPSLLQTPIFATIDRRRALIRRPQARILATVTPMHECLR